jgi:hypothetical protein
VAVNGHSISSKPIGLWLSHMSLLFVHFVVEAPLLGAFAKLRNFPKNERLPSLSVGKNSVSTVRIFMEFDARIFFENLSRQFIFD